LYTNDVNIQFNLRWLGTFSFDFFVLCFYNAKSAGGNLGKEMSAACGCSVP